MDDRTSARSSSLGDPSDTNSLASTAPGRTPASLAMPSRIDRYELLGVLGRGGMGTVYAAHDPQLDRKVALKLLDSLHESERLRREARALARLSHENVVRIFDVGIEGDRLYVVMEIIEGRTLRQWMNATPRHPWPEVVRVLEAAGRGLAAAHALGLVHRDFKPGNVLIGNDGRVCVVDFGLARAVEGDELAAQTSENELWALGSVDGPAIDAQITATGAVVGTPAYMAPEQWLRGVVDRRADIFGFCVTAWEALYGTRPFLGDSARAVAQRTIRGLVDEPPDSDVPAWLHDALLRGLRVDPAQRPSSMEEMLRIVAGPPARSRRGWALAGGGAAIVALGAVGWLALDSREPAACAGMSAPMDELWTPERRAAIATAMQAAGPSYAQAAWERIEPTLDAYAGAWVEARTRACQARRESEAGRETADEAERGFDLRMQCLEHRRVALATLLDVLEASEPAALEAGSSLAWRLPAIDDCDDLDGLQQREARPDDPAARDAVDAARRRLARTRVLVDAGRYAEALADTEALLAEAERLGWPPLAAEVGLVRGIALFHEGRLDDGAALLDQALLDAVTARRDDLAIEAALARAHALAGGGRLDEAAAMVTRAEGMWRSAGEPAPQGVRLLQASAQVALRRGEYPEARRLLEEGVQRMRTLGDDGPTLADSLANLSTIEQLMGELEPARTHCAEAIEIRERTQGPSHPDLALDLHNLAVTHAMQHQLDQAEPLFERSLAIKTETLGREHPAVAASLTALGTVALERGQTADAERRFVEAVALLERALGPEHPELYYPVFGLAQIHLERDPPTGARELLRRSIALLEGTAGPTHPELAAPLRKLGELELREGQPAEALAVLRRSVELSAGIVEDPLEAAELRLWLARALWDGGGDRAEAVELLREALERLPPDSTDPEHQRVRTDLERWLADHPRPPA